MSIIDAHHHLWKYNPDDYPWIGDGMEALRRDFLPDDLQALMRENPVDGFVAVQAQQSEAETKWLLELAEQNDFMRGVVGWAPLTDPDVGSVLERLAENKKLKGIRHILQDEPDDDYMLGEAFNRGVAQLAPLGLSYDILVFERHLPQTLKFVDRHPDQVFIVDHMAKPRIRERIVSPWRELIGELAARPNVWCKISGMATEADWRNWNEADLKPYIDTVLAEFGPKRLMFGSDWPVLLPASDYARWIEVFRQAIAHLSHDERDWICRNTAIEAYRLL
ncbi:MAG: amidohydrolase family protein [Acidobacteria bacterium]|nr:amidohydrolase family protein [Acidobacteriota bacterium]